MYWQTDRQKRKEFESVVAERKAKEKNEAWIKELEARDEEEKQFKAAKEARRKMAMEKAEKVEVKAVKGDGKGASSMIDDCERRRKGTMEMVEELLLNGRK